MRTIPFEFGDVVLVPFPFTNHTASKQRPAVIVSNLAYSQAKPDVVVMAITSQFRPGPTPSRNRRNHPTEPAALLRAKAGPVEVSDRAPVGPVSS
jgi:mRNA interferase MazF